MLEQKTENARKISILQVDFIKVHYLEYVKIEKKTLFQTLCVIGFAPNKISLTITCFSHIA